MTFSRLLLHNFLIFPNVVPGAQCYFCEQKKRENGRRGAVKIDCVVEVKEYIALFLPPFCSIRDKYPNAPLTKRVTKPNFFTNSCSLHIHGTRNNSSINPQMVTVN